MFQAIWIKKSLKSFVNIAGLNLMDLQWLICPQKKNVENIEVGLMFFIFLALYKKMSGFYLIVKAKKETPTVNNSRILTYFDTPIEFDLKKKYEMALVGFDSVHSYTNINSTNNVFRYSPNSGTSNYTIYIEEGANELNELNTYLQDEMKKQVGNLLYRADGVVIGANLSTSRATLKFGKPGPTTHYWVDFNVNNSLAPVLGFTKGEYTYVEKREDPTDPDKVTSNIDYYESMLPTRLKIMRNSSSVVWSLSTINWLIAFRRKIIGDVLTIG